MWTVRRQVSLLLDHGHPEARRYPIGIVWDEAELVVERLNGRIATEAVLTQMAVSSVLSEKAGKQFNKMVKKLSGGAHGD